LLDHGGDVGRDSALAVLLPPLIEELVSRDLTEDVEFEGRQLCSQSSSRKLKELKILSQLRLQEK
jgi:hypothetical protein